MIGQQRRVMHQCCEILTNTLYKAIIIAVVLALDLLAASDCSAQMTTPDQVGLRVSYQNSDLARDLSVVVATIEPELFELETALGIKISRSGEIYFCSDLEDFSRKLQFEPPDWYNAVAQDSLKQIVVWVKPNQSPAMVSKVLSHELMHWALFSLPPAVAKQLPLWLHEGLAEMWSDAGLSNTYEVSLAWESLQNRLPRLNSYKNNFSDEPYRAAVGYALSKEVVVYLRNNYGNHLFRQLFEAMANGRTLDQALIDNTGLSIVTHELAVRANLNSWWRFVQEMHPNFFLLVVVSILFLIPAVMRRRRMHKLAIHKAWQTQEDALDIYDEQGDNISDEKG